MARRDNEDDIPTPKQTGSWAISVGRSQALITRLERASVAFKSANVLQRDLEAAELCDSYVVVLRDLIERFSGWPTRTREDVETERRALLGYLDELTRNTDRLCAKLGKSW